MKGIDISSWQNGISADAINSKDFAIFKISEGRTWTDPCFNSFYEVAKIPVGAYVYSYATTESVAREEARKVLSLINGRKLPLGIFMDVENPTQLALRDSELTAVVKAFCDTIRDGGYICGAYGSAGQLWAKVGAKYLGDDVLVWAASWGAQPRFECDVWQYTDNEAINGYNGPVDGDEAMSERFIALVCGNAPATSGETETPVESPYFTLTIPALQHGDVGDAVKALQGELIAAGYRCGGKIVNGAERADGIFGNVTRESVATFQRTHNIVDTGIADRLTRAALLGVKTELEG